VVTLLVTIGKKQVDLQALLALKTLHNVVKNLTIATLVYISAPTYFFLLFWLKPHFAFISILCLLAAFVLAIWKLNEPDIKANKINMLPVLASSFTLAALVCAFSEFGILPYQSYDYLAHNYKFNLLATQDLPLYSPDRQVHMCYYLGNYIIPSLLGKYLSLKLIKFFFFAWCTIGLGLTYTWIQIKVIHLNHWRRVFICAALIVGSYVCVIFPTLNQFVSGLPIMEGNSLVVNGKFVLNQVPIFTRGLSESPQHILPAILGISFLLAIGGKPAYFNALAYFFLGTLFLTPFAAIGLLGFLILSFINNISKEGKTFFLNTTLYSIPLLIAYLPVVLFLTSSEATAMDSNRTLWQTDTAYWWVYYLIYLFSSYGIWFLFFGKRLFQFDSNALLISLGFVFVISLFQIGYYNDLNIRSSVVPQMIFGLSIAYVLVTNARLIFKKRILTFGVLFWCLNSVSPLKFYYERLFVLKGQRNTIENPLPQNAGDGYYDLLESAYQKNGKEVVKQYSLRKGTFFEKFLLNKNTMRQ
jgi:hypothetical protein